MENYWVGPRYLAWCPGLYPQKQLRYHDKSAIIILKNVSNRTEDSFILVQLILMNETVKDIQWIVLYGLFNSIYLQYVCEHTRFTNISLFWLVFF